MSLAQVAADKTKSLLSATAAKAAQKLSGLLSMIGIAGVIHSQVIKYIFGMYFTHPGVFVGSIVAAILLQVGSEKIEESHLIGEIDSICENLKVVTSNLHSHYTHASNTLTRSFLEEDSKEVVMAVH
jgi:hypothetical protein